MSEVTSDVIDVIDKSLVQIDPETCFVVKTIFALLSIFMILCLLILWHLLFVYAHSYYGTHGGLITVCNNS